MASPRPHEVSRVAAVVGAASSLGEAVTSALLDVDWAVAACDDASVNGSSARARTMIELDLLDRGAVAGAVQTIEGEFGALDALILLPPSLPDSSIVGLSTDAWRAALRSQVLVAANFCWATVPSMVARGAGNIVVVASDAALGGGSGGVLTASASGAAIGFAKALAIELAKTGVQVNAVCSSSNERPSDIAATVRYLADETHFFLGQVLTTGGPR
jgi:NAD(P)-dependent dehydrogenase (short-subunit alcohol dehydrogenase family)